MSAGTITIQAAFRMAYEAGMSNVPVDFDALAGDALGKITSVGSASVTIGDVLSRSLRNEWAAAVEGCGGWTTDPMGPPAVWLVTGYEHDDPCSEIYDAVLAHAEHEAMTRACIPAQYGARLLVPATA